MNGEVVIKPLEMCEPAVEMNGDGEAHTPTPLPCGRILNTAQ